MCPLKAVHNMLCHHCWAAITLTQPRLNIRPPHCWPDALWSTYHADCYVRAETVAALALGILPAHMQDALTEAKIRADLAQGATLCA